MDDLDVYKRQPQDIRTIPVDMDEMRRKYIKMNVKDKGFDNLTAEEVEFLAAETNLDIAGIRRLLDDMDVSIA